MGGEGHIAAMIASIKNNNRRKNKHTSFSTDNPNYKKGSPIKSRELTEEEKKVILEKIGIEKKREDKLRVYRLIISLGLTIVFIGCLIMIIKTVFF